MSTTQRFPWCRCERNRGIIVGNTTNFEDATDELVADAQDRLAETDEDLGLSATSSHADYDPVAALTGGDEGDAVVRA